MKQEQNNKDFYRAFEDKFRGSKVEIKNRLKVYLPFAKALSKKYPKKIAIDLGCGRGEMVELLIENKIPAKGVDINPHMLDSKKTIKADLLSYLKRQRSESAIMISAIHVAEHLPFDKLQKMVSESLRVLVPGGILIMETPNPENLMVGSHSFYLDPTHLKPIPPSLLAFIPEYYGFKTVKLLRLQERRNIKNQKEIKLIDIFQGVSPDYAVLAQKSGFTDKKNPIQKLLNRDYGVTLDFLIEKYSKWLKK